MADSTGRHLVSVSEERNKAALASRHTVRSFTLRGFPEAREEPMWTLSLVLEYSGKTPQFKLQLNAQLAL